MKHDSIHLKKAAEIILMKMKTPAAFLEFLAEALSWVHEYELEKQKRNVSKDPHFNLILLIDHIAIPWITSAGDHLVDELTKGMYEVADALGHKGFDEGNVEILAAFANDLGHGTTHKEFLEKQLNGINTLMEISFCLYDLEVEERNKKAAA